MIFREISFVSDNAPERHLEECEDITRDGTKVAVDLHVIVQGQLRAFG